MYISGAKYYVCICSIHIYMYILYIYYGPTLYIYCILYMCKPLGGMSAARGSCTHFPRIQRFGIWTGRRRERDRRERKGREREGQGEGYGG